LRRRHIQSTKFFAKVVFNDSEVMSTPPVSVDQSFALSFQGSELSALVLRSFEIPHNLRVEVWEKACGAS
jgi:hypothetical protein